MEFCGVSVWLHSESVGGKRKDRFAGAVDIEWLWVANGSKHWRSKMDDVYSLVVCQRTAIIPSRDQCLESRMRNLATQVEGAGHQGPPGSKGEKDSMAIDAVPPHQASWFLSQ